MKDGLYNITFTTTEGTLGEGACLVRDGTFVGADFLHSYHGTIASDGSRLTVVMHCRRHAAEFVSQMNLPMEFDLHWKGEETTKGFVVETPLPGAGVILRATLDYIER
jgi:hypothetical protein